jgi:hypothetical protein
MRRWVSCGPNVPGSAGWRGESSAGGGAGLGRPGRCGTAHRPDGGSGDRGGRGASGRGAVGAPACAGRRRDSGPRCVTWPGRRDGAAAGAAADRRTRRRRRGGCGTAGLPALRPGGEAGEVVGGDADLPTLRPAGAGRALRPMRCGAGGEFPRCRRSADLRGLPQPRPGKGGAVCAVRPGSASEHSHRAGTDLRLVPDPGGGGMQHVRTHGALPAIGVDRRTALPPMPQPAGPVRRLRTGAAGAQRHRDRSTLRLVHGT